MAESRLRIVNEVKSQEVRNNYIDIRMLHGLGWKHTVELEEGIEMMYNWYKNQ